MKRSLKKIVGIVGGGGAIVESVHSENILPEK